MDKQEETKKEKKLHVEIVRQMLTLATAGFGLVAALAWNSFIQEFVKQYIQVWFPNGGGLFTLFLYAVIVTFLAVIITLQLTKFLRKLENK